ncbi:MAG: DUF1349 domain-containing protein [Cytophagales bacterium]|nr:DUF1349 domain-containing protein [Cytophaga sp.]
MKNIALITILFVVLSCSKQTDTTLISPVTTPIPSDNFALDFNAFKWVHQPKLFNIQKDTITITTDPNTDYWQRTYYGFQNDNAPTFVKNIIGDFTFSVRTDFDSKKQFDQCGIIVYQDSENWMKSSIEYENETYSRLGSVATNLGYSDWATTDIPADTKTMWYRLSRRGQDFFIETSKDGEHYIQLRVVHMHKPIDVAHVGIYACSPKSSSFQAVFSDFKLGNCLWKEHKSEE